jgi:hypothetical protein
MMMRFNTSATTATQESSKVLGQLQALRITTGASVHAPMDIHSAVVLGWNDIASGAGSRAVAGVCPANIKETGVIAWTGFDHGTSRIQIANVEHDVAPGQPTKKVSSCVHPASVYSSLFYLVFNDEMVFMIRRFQSYPLLNISTLHAPITLLWRWSTCLKRGE